MAEKDKTYTQDDLDKAIEAALVKQKTDDTTAGKKAADAEIAKQKEASITELAKQKAELEEKFGKLSDDEKAAYEKKIAEMTSKDDMKTILDAHGKQVQAEVHDTIKRNALISEYGDVVRGSPVAGAPFMADGAFDQGLFDTEIEGLGGMQTAAIAGIVSKVKMVAAAVPGKSKFDTNPVSGTPPGSETSETQDMAAIEELRAATGRI